MRHTPTNMIFVWVKCALDSNQKHFRSRINKCLWQLEFVCFDIVMRGNIQMFARETPQHLLDSISSQWNDLELVYWFSSGKFGLSIAQWSQHRDGMRCVFDEIWKKKRFLTKYSYKVSFLLNFNACYAHIGAPFHFTKACLKCPFGVTVKSKAQRIMFHLRFDLNRKIMVHLKCLKSLCPLFRDGELTK